MSEEEQAAGAVGHFVLPTWIAGVGLAERRLHLRRLRPGTELVLARDPDNEYDENAVRVLDREGNTLGSVPEGVSEQVAALLDQAGADPASVRAIVNRVIVGGPEGAVIGASIVVLFRPDRDAEAAETSELRARSRLRRAVIAVISVIVIVSLLALVILGAWRVVPRERQAPPAPIYAMQTR
jgi:hypothetical protein